MSRVALKFISAMFAAVILLALLAVPSHALEAHIFRGLGDFSFIAQGLTFSQGMDRLADKFNASGVRAQAYRWDQADSVYRDIMRRKPAAVALVGHSMGAVAVLALARRLEGTGVRVAYLGTIDIPGPASVVPGNVEAAENYYHAFPVFGHLSKPRGFKGTVKNEFVFGQMHITMDKARKVQDGILTAALADTRAKQPETLQAYDADAEVRSSEQLTAKVEAVLSAGSAKQTQPMKSGYAGIVAHDVAQVDAGMITGSVETARSGSATEAGQEIRRYQTKSGLPPIE